MGLKTCVLVQVILVSNSVGLDTLLNLTVTHEHGRHLWFPNLAKHQNYLSLVKINSSPASILQGFNGVLESVVFKVL